jgi:hypothetical protein
VSASIVEAGVHDATGGALAATDAAGDALGVLVADAGHLPYGAIAVATGDDHVCALLDDHNVKCWGGNSYGELGYGNTPDRGGLPSDMGDALPIVDLGTGRTATQISAAYHTTCAILDDGSVKCWGYVGLTGVPVVPNETTPSTAGPWLVKADAGVIPFAMGDRLPPLDFGGRKATHIAVAAFVACASMEDDTLWCWGEDTSNGTPELEGKSTHGKVVALSQDQFGSVFALFEDGSVDDVFGSHNASSLTAGGRKAVAIGGGLYNETCAVLDDGTATCLPSPTGTDALPVPLGTVALGIGSLGWCTLDSQGTVRCNDEDGYCGAGTGGSGGAGDSGTGASGGAGGSVQPAWCPSAGGDMPLGQPAVAITSGGDYFSFSCALLTDGGVKCWGVRGSLAGSPWLGAEFGVDWSSADPGDNVPTAWPEIDLGTHL